MATKTNTKAKKTERGPSRFIDGAELRHELNDIDHKTLRAWIKAGTVPPPHSRPGDRTELWLRRHFDHYDKTGQWPEEAFPSGRAGGS